MLVSESPGTTGAFFISGGVVPSSGCHYWKALSCLLIRISQKRQTVTAGPELGSSKAFEDQINPKGQTAFPLAGDHRSWTSSNRAREPKLDLELTAQAEGCY
jgi:hypothetical protein